MIFYRHIHFLLFALVLGLSVAMYSHFNFSQSRSPASTKKIDPNSWELSFNRTKKIWGVYEIESETIGGVSGHLPTHAIVEKDGLHIFREYNTDGLATEVVHLKIPFNKKENSAKAKGSPSEITLVLDSETKATLREFTDGREVEEINCEKKWKTLSCEAKLAELVGPHLGPNALSE